MTTAAPPDAAEPPARNPWFANPTFDLLWIVGTPLLVWPLVMGAQHAWSADLLTKLILVTATGHYFATFVRAYGDHLLFRRFSVRFVVAPVVLGAVCIGGIQLGYLAPLVLVTALWGLWHWLAQAFGFSRIYDAKVGSFRPLTALLDKLLVVAWFLGAVVLLPNASANFANLFVEAGVTLPDAGAFEVLRTAVTAIVAAVTVAYVANLVWTVVRGEPVSWIKQCCHVTTIGFYWFAFGYMPNLLVGYVLYELFHDIQYFAITWLSCRSRVQRDGVAPWMRAMFQPGWARAGLFLAAMLVFGALDMGGRGALETGSGAHNVLLGVVLTAAVLHYYYDGFIWKVREDALRGDLGMRGGLQVRSRAFARHAAAWGFFFVPLVLLSAKLPKPDERDAFQEAAALVAAAPGSFDAQSRYATFLAQSGDLEGARTAYEVAVEQWDGHTQTLFNYGALLEFVGDVEAAALRYRQALACEDVEVHGRSQHGEAHLNLGVLLAARGEDRAAADHFKAAALLGLKEPLERFVPLGQQLALRDPDRAMRILAAAARFGGERAGLPPLILRAVACNTSGNLDGAAAALRELLAGMPMNSEALVWLADVCRRQGRLAEVKPQVDALLRIAPDQPQALELLREISGG